MIDNQSYDHTPNWTPLVPITIFNYLHGTLNFLAMYVNQNFNFKFYKGGRGLIFVLISEFTGLIPKAPLKTWTVMLFTIEIFYNLIFCRYYYTYGLLFVPQLTILDIGKRWKMVKVLNSTTQSICVTYSVLGLCILHDTNLVLSGSHHQDTLSKNALYMSKIDYSLFKYDIFPLFLSNRDNILHVTEWPFLC